MIHRDSLVVSRQLPWAQAAVGIGTRRTDALAESSSNLSIYSIVHNGKEKLQPHYPVTVMPALVGNLIYLNLRPSFADLLASLIGVVLEVLVEELAELVDFV